MALDEKYLRETEALPLRKRLARRDYLLFKLKEKGVLRIPGWLLSLAADFTAKKTLPARAFLASRPARLFGGRSGMKTHGTLSAFYDLSVAPETFDILVFLALADIRRRELGLERVHVIIVPGPKNGFSDDYSHLYGLKNKIWRLRNVLVPSCWLLASCRGVTVCAAREDAAAIYSSAAAVFPENYSPAVPVSATLWRDMLACLKKGVALPRFTASEQALEYADAWIAARNKNGRKIVSVSLRESGHLQERNSNVKAWGDFARSLPDECLPVIIRDTEKAVEPAPEELRGLLLFNEAACNLDLRAAFYMRSHLNMLISNGPAALAYLLEGVRVLVFKVTTPGVMVTTPEYIKETIGIGPGDNPVLDDRVRLVWEDDTLEVIQREFQKTMDSVKR
jgi:hypothetical protein